jgi:hypothetical protein
MRTFSSRRKLSICLDFSVVVLLLSIFHFAACGEEQGSFAGVDLPGIRVTPDVVSFSQLALGERESQMVFVENTGGGALIISNYYWSDSARDFDVEGLQGLVVDSQGILSFEVIYEPQDDSPDESQLIIESNGGQASVTVSSLGQESLLRTDPEEVFLVSDGVGEAVAQNLLIYNAGTKSLRISQLSIVTASSDFQMVPLDFSVPVDVLPNQIFTVQVIYTPSGFGSEEGNLLIEHNDDNEASGATVVPITGALRTPLLEVIPSFVEFNAVPMGEVREESAILTNVGQSQLDIYDLYMTFDASEDMSIVSLGGVPFVGDAFESTSLASGESTELVLSYTPSDSEDDWAAAVVFSNDPEFPILEIEMGGRLDSPYLSVTPSGLSYGSVAMGLTRDLTLTVSNIGTGELLMEVPSLEASDDFQLLNAEEMPLSLFEDETFELAVRFQPQTEGNLFGDLTVSATNDPYHSPVEVLLVGFGAGEAYCELTPVPTTVNYGLVPRGSTQVGYATVYNVGTGNCEIDQVFLQPPPFGGLMGDIFSDAFELISVSIPDGTLLGPGDEFQVTTSYSPIEFTALTESLGDTASVEIVAIDPHSGDSVECGSVSLFSFTGVSRECGINLQGTSGVANIAAIPSSVDFGLVTRGCNSQETEVDIYNIGSAPVTVSNIVFESCTGEFSLSGVPPEISAGEGFTLESGASPISLNVQFEPGLLSVSSCELVITSDVGETERLVVPLTGEGTDLTEQIDVFEQVSGQEVDVLFVVDNSASMSEEQASLVANFDRFIDAAQLWENNFQIGVITTEPDEEYAGRQPGELLGDPRILVRETTNLENEFVSNASVGDSGDGIRESGLEAAYLALTDPLISDVGPCDDTCIEPYACVPDATGVTSQCGGYNRSFLREDASLELIFVSDEADHSRGTLEFYSDFFQSIKGVMNEGMFNANAITGPHGGCEGAGGIADPGDGYLDLAEETGGVIGSICDSDFSESLENIGDSAFGIRIQFFLSRVADPDSITVSDTAGADLSGWTFDEGSNSVIFDEASVPLPGDLFEVYYTALCF